jgi:hypothetical protein
MSAQCSQAVLRQKKVRESRLSVAKDAVSLGLKRLALRRQGSDIAGSVHSGGGEEHRYRSHGRQQAKAKAQDVSS